MHILVALISGLAGLIWALYRLQNSGVNLNSFNPFYWARRRKWKVLYGTKPIYNLRKPMDAAAAIIVGVLKQEGEISREQKQSVIALFRSTFNISDQEAIDLFASSAYLLKDELNFSQSIKAVLAPNIAQFTPDMAGSFVDILDKVANLEGPPTDSQVLIISTVKSELEQTGKPSSKWG